MVDLEIAVQQAAQQALTNAGSPVPSPVTISALVDTGASGSLIQHGVAQQLGLNPIGVVPVNTPSSQGVQCPVFAVRFLFPNSIVYEGSVIEAPLQGQNIQGLIGRDVLRHAVLVYIGYTNQFTLSF